MPSIHKAVDHFGGQAALARAIGASPAQVWQWCHGHRPVPARSCIDIERATNGAVTCADLLPKVFGETEAEAA